MRIRGEESDREWGGEERREARGLAVEERMRRS
jgi:hypothetical protein